MKKYIVGIVTFIQGTNYGCVLQRYALQTTLERFCSEVKTLMFRPDSPEGITLNRRLKSVLPIRNLYDIIQLIKLAPLLVFERFFVKRQKIRRTSLFTDFEKRFLKNTVRLNSYVDVVKEGENFDILVAGSDQIWNMTWNKGDEFYKYYMLDFVPNQKRISYAASLGISFLPVDEVPKYQRYLSDFVWISVRENEGAKEIERILNRPIDVVLDPTMLLSLEEWDLLANQFSLSVLEKSPYILSYSLGNLEGIVEKARQIQKIHRLPIVYICTNSYDYIKVKIKYPSIKTILNAGPGEFVFLVKNAACVVTDSFHGSVFSILYHKPFFTMMRDKEDPTKSMNSRMTTLFSTFHLESQLFSSDDKSPLTPESFEIDYEAVDKILQERREFSVNKLREAIENVVKQQADA